VAVDVSGNGRNAVTTPASTKTSTKNGTDSGTENGNESGRNRDAESARAARALGLGTGWAVFSYLISGMVAYGIIGWAVGKAVHVSLLFPVGMLVGLAISVGYVIHRYGRQASVEQSYRGQRRNDR
jgi:F0F1-type ATP synthase assembly protein I